MSEFYVVCDIASGAVRWRGSGPEGAAELQELTDGLAAYVVPQAAIVGAEVDLEAVRAAAIAAVDAAAETVRLRFITPGTGQALTYQYKAEEARAWSADHGATTPFLSAEAGARGMTIAALAAEVLDQVASLILIGSRIEAARMGAKDAIKTAATVPTIAAAAAIDWQAALA